MNNKNSKIVCDCLPDRNIFYYFNNDQYEIFEKSMNNWNTQLGSFSVQKCLDYLIDIDKSCGLGYDFENIEKEEKLHYKIEKIKELEPGGVYF